MGVFIALIFIFAIFGGFISLGVSVGQDHGFFQGLLAFVLSTSLFLGMMFGLGSCLQYAMHGHP